MNMKRGMMLLLLLLVIPSVSAQVWYNTSLNYLGVLNFANIYDNYALYFDAIIYLFIFLGLGMSVFGVVAANEPEKEKAYRLIYIGLALLLTISLLLLESRMGFTLLDKLGPFTAFILLIFLIFSAYKIFNFFLENKWISIGLTTGATLVFLDSFYNYFEGFPFLGALINDIIQSGIHRVLYIFAVLGVLAWIVKKFGLKPTKPGKSQPEVVTPEREPPGGIGIPADVLASLQEKDQIIDGLRVTIGDYDVKFQELKRQIEDAKATGDSGLSERLADQSKEFEERMSAFTQETSEKLKGLNEEFEKERKLLKDKIMTLEREQKITLEKLKNEIQESGKTALKTKLAELGRQIAGYKKAASVAAEEAKKLLWARSEAERMIKSGISLEKYSGLPIMQPKPVPLLPAPKEEGVLAEEFKREEGIVSPEELEAALQAEASKDEKAVVNKIDTGLKYINKLFEEIPGPRNALYTEKGIRELVYSIFSGRKYKANIVLEDLRDNLERLGRAAELYLKIAPSGKYSPYLKRFSDEYKGLRSSFIKIAQYSKLRDKVRLDLKDINNLSPIVYKKLRQNYAMIYKVGEGVNEVIDNNRMLSDIQKNLLHQKVDVLEKYGKAFEEVLIRHFNQLPQVQKTVQAISVAISKLRSETHKYRVG